MHSWANVSHYLSYKSDTDIPDDLKHDFNAISGLFYMADKHFELFYESSVKSREAAVKSLSSSDRDLAQAINLDSMNAYLAWKFPDRKHSDQQGVSNLVKELIDYGYASLAQVDDVVTKANSKFRQYEKASPPYQFSGSKSQAIAQYADVGVVRVSLQLSDPRYPHAYETQQKLKAVRAAKGSSRRR